MESIDGAREAISRLASQDMNFAIHAKVRVNAMLERLSTLNQSTESTLDSVFTITREVDQLVGDAVRSLQFEDIVRQLAVYSERHLDRIHGVINRIHGGLSALGGAEQRTKEEYVAALRQLQGEVEAFLSNERANDSRPVAQDSMAEGDVVLF